MKKWHWLLLVFMLVVIDQASKYWIEAVLIPYKPVVLMPMLNITLAYNTGAAFSFLSGVGGWHRWFFAGFSLLMSLFLAIWLWRTPANKTLQNIGISFILGGALGNLIDRAFQGYVVDFIDVYYKQYHFATFNVADSVICIGAGLLILDLFFVENRSVKMNA
jgi:signal peptidase II